MTAENTSSNTESGSERPPNCLNCETPIDGEFCKVCGQASSTARYSFSSLAQEIYAQLRRVEAAKTVKTIWKLTFSPGLFVQDYLAGKRTDYVNPVRFFFYCFFIELTAKLAFARLLPGNPIVANAHGGISLELLNLGLTIVWGVLWSLLYYKEDLNLVEYVVAAIFFVGQTFLLSTALLLVMLPLTNIFQSPEGIHSILDLTLYFVYSCIFAYALFNVRLPFLILKQISVALVFISIIWILYSGGILTLLG